MVSTKKFDKVEMTPFRIKCDVHGWMKSYMAVLPHPYHSVSQGNGTFSIGNLPPGNYTLVAWHEKYGQQEQQVTVAAERAEAGERSRSRDSISELLAHRSKGSERQRPMSFEPIA